MKLGYSAEQLLELVSQAQSRTLDVSKEIRNAWDNRNKYFDILDFDTPK
jgi:hypothetical protein